MREQVDFGIDIIDGVYYPVCAIEEGFAIAFAPETYVGVDPSVKSTSTTAPRIRSQDRKRALGSVSRSGMDGLMVCGLTRRGREDQDQDQDQYQYHVQDQDQDHRPTHCAQGAIFRRNFCIAMTFGLPTSSSVAQACRLSEDKVVMSKSMRRMRPTPLYRLGVSSGPHTHRAPVLILVGLQLPHKLEYP
jgi:hypothetical protein